MSARLTGDNSTRGLADGEVVGVVGVVFAGSAAVLITKVIGRIGE